MLRKLYLSHSILYKSGKEKGNHSFLLKMAAASIDGKSCQETSFCVTGGTGFVASWLVKRLLDKGYMVHATVRHPENEAKVRHLLDIPGAAERLKLFRADLLEDGSFDAAIDRCDGVFHVASPVIFKPKDPENELIKPAIEGTLNVLRACKKAQTVKRVVVTSSGTATHKSQEAAEQNEQIDESSWTDIDSIQTKKPGFWEYTASKSLAERAALQYGKEHHLDVLTIIPVLVMGSSITPSVPLAVQLGLSLLTDNPQMVQGLKASQMSVGAIRLIHVDDLASAHIFLMENTSAEGRYICSAINTSLPRLTHFLSKRYPEYNVPTQFEDVPESPKTKMSSKKLVESGFSFKFGLEEIYHDAVEYVKTKGLLNQLSN